MFRVNRDVIVLNDLAAGALFVNELGGMDLGNWEELLPEKKNSEDDQERDTPPTPADRNRPPVAEPDQYGARPGQAATLHVLDNDSDPRRRRTGDPPVSTTPPPDTGRLAIVNNGQALQFTSAPGWSQTARFRYTVDDGRGGAATTDVTGRPAGRGHHTARVAATR